MNAVKIALCGICRLENNYLREWVEHYKSIGFDKIFLYDNNLPDEEHAETPIKEYVEDGFVEIINVRKSQTCQVQSYNECYNLHSDEFDWMAFFDIDEFLILENNKSIKDVLEKYNDFDNICLFYNTYDDNGLVRVIDGDYSLLKRFTHKVDNDFNTTRKSIVKTKLSEPNIGAHGANNQKLKYCNTLYENIKVNEWGVEDRKHISYSVMKLNHYRLKTIEEFITNRIKKGDGWKIDGKNRHPEWFTLDAFFKYNLRTPEKEEYAKHLLDEK